MTAIRIPFHPLQVFSKSKSRIAALKAPMGMDVLSYQDLSWRLDVEVSCGNESRLEDCPIYAKQTNLLSPCE